MAVESPIDPEDNWFKGETKVLRWTVRDEETNEIQNVTGWDIEFNLYVRRQGGEPVITQAVTVEDGPNGRVETEIEAEDTTELVGESFGYVVQRIDAGMEAVLAFGGAVCRDPSRV